MAKNKLTDLRDHLFEMLESLKEADSESLPREIQRADTVCKISHAITETAKAEIRYAAAFDALPGSRFFELEERPDDLVRRPADSRDRRALQAVNGR